MVATRGPPARRDRCSWSAWSTRPPLLHADPIADVDQRRLRRALVRCELDADPQHRRGVIGRVWDQPGPRAHARRDVDVATDARDVQEQRRDCEGEPRLIDRERRQVLGDHQRDAVRREREPNVIADPVQHDGSLVARAKTPPGVGPFFYERFRYRFGHIISRRGWHCGDHCAPFASSLGLAHRLLSNVK